VSEERIVLQIAPGELEHAVDHAMLLLPAGLQVDEEANAIIAVGEPHELPSREELVAALHGLVVD
jgi:hypothetical protein